MEKITRKWIILLQAWKKEGYFGKCQNNRKMYDIHSEVFSGTGCIKGTFSLQVNEDTKPYQVPHRHVVYVLQELFTKELENLQEQK